jgi:hypothetical protein
MKMKTALSSNTKEISGHVGPRALGTSWVVVSACELTDVLCLCRGGGSIRRSLRRPVLEMLVFDLPLFMKYGTHVSSSLRFVLLPSYHHVSKKPMPHPTQSNDTCNDHRLPSFHACKSSSRK